MAENDPKLTPEAASSDDPFSVFVRMSHDLARMAVSGVPASWDFRPRELRAVPVTMKKDDGVRYLVGLDFETAGDAEQFADGLEAFVDRVVGARIFLTSPAAIIWKHGNVSGVH